MPNATCSDSAQNGTETDVDCGGGACGACANGKKCNAPSDCTLGACTDGRCELAACSNQTKDSSESDVDCGGASCGPCDDGKSCGAPADCKSALCSGGVCVAPSCSDGAKNGNETGIDCGGACAPCPSAVNPSVPYNFAKGIEFLYTGANAHQTGLVGGTLDPVRVAVLRGRVLDRGLAPVADVRVSVRGNPNLGSSKTRADGTFDLVVNGGGFVTLDFEKAGVIPVQRKLTPRPRTWATVEDVLVTPLDTAVTAIDFSAPIQTHRATVQQDSDGPRRASIMFAQGTTAGMEVGNATQPLSTLNVRATEVTTGPHGRKAMPGELPASSAYTYAVELSVDEALAANATSVVFSKPVVTYVDNFLGFTPGKRVPVGYYDRAASQWVPSDDGLVIKVLSVTGGMADLDLAGSGVAADGTALAAWGITDAERTELAKLYAAGATLWRVAMTHFTTYDCNWPFTPPDDAVLPPEQNQPDESEEDDPDCSGGSVIECQNGVLGERLPVAGSTLSLNYRTSRIDMPARRRRSMLITSASVPASLLEVEALIEIAGRRFVQKFQPLPNQTWDFEWDGNDVYGRPVSGAMTFTFRLGYRYKAEYKTPSLDPNSAFQRSFNRPSFAGIDGYNTQNGFNREQDRGAITMWRTWQISFGQADVGGWNAKGVGLGAFTLDPHHTYEAAAGSLWRGDGTRRTARNIQRTGGYLKNLGVKARDIAFGSDGSIYGIALETIWRMKPGSAAQVIAGITNPTNLSDGDGGSALNARLNRPRYLTLGPDDSVYFTEWTGAIRKISPAGIITRIAGATSGAKFVEGGLATEAFVSKPAGIAVSGDGTVYFVDRFAGGVRPSGIRSITTDGRIHYVYTVDFTSPYWGLAPGGPLRIDNENNLYVAHNGVLRFRPSGATDVVYDKIVAGQYFGAKGVALVPSGHLLVSEVSSGFERMPNGTRNYFLPGLLAKGDPDTQTYPNVSVAPDGQIYMMPYAQATQSSYEDGNVTGNLHAYAPTTAFTAGDTTMPSDDGEEIYVFDGEGRHKRTATKAGVDLWQFGYDNAGLLTELTDRNGRKTTIEHDTSGNPTAIVAPGGQRTVLAVDANGYLSKVTYPAGESFSMTFGANGALTQMVDRRGGVHTFDYDANGRLVKDTDALGKAKTVAATYSLTGRQVIVTTPLGATTTYTTSVTRGQSAAPKTRTKVDAAGGTSKSLTSGAAVPGFVAADDTHVDVALEPDDRFGLYAPARRSVTYTTPGGKSLVSFETRAISLAIPVEPTSLTEQVDTIVTNGRTSTSTFDVANHTITNVSAANRTSRITLDAKERPVAMTADVTANVTPVVVTYDANGRVSSLSHGPVSRTTDFDASDRAVAMTDALGRKTQLAYDASDRVNAVTLPSGKVYAFTFDAAGNRTSITMPSGAKHDFSYDARDLMTAYTAPGGSVVASVIDDDRRLSRLTQPGGRVIDNTFDAIGRQTSATYAEASVATTYVGATRRAATLTLTPTTGAAQSLAFSYDGGLLIGMAASGAANGAYAFVHDSNFWVTAIQLDGGTPSVRTRDNDGLVVQSGPFTILRAGPAGVYSGVNDGANPVLTVGYDALARETSRVMTSGGGTKYSYAWTFDNGGQPATKVENAAGKDLQFEYTYDLDGQLVMVKRTDVGAATSSCDVYGYDANGNRTSKKSGTCGAEENTETTTFDARDRILTRGATAYTYDAAGFLTQRGPDTFAYGARGELFAATLEAGQPSESVIAYAYDGLGRRVARTDAGGTTQYLYASAGFEVTHTKAPGNVLTEYFYDDAGRLFGLVRAGVKYLVATDAVGSPRIVTKTDGTVVYEVEYDAFGRVVAGDPTAFDLPVGFAGGIPDAATKLVRMGRRDYDPVAGRFTAPDPALFEGGLNLYAYAHNEPVLHVDRNGLSGTICDALKQLADYEKQKGGKKPYANSVLPWFSNGRILGGVGDGNVTVGRNGRETVNGVDFNYFETAYAGSAQGGTLFGVGGNLAYTTIASGLHLVNRMSLKDAWNNFLENAAGTFKGAEAARYPSIEAYRKAQCECE